MYSLEALSAQILRKITTAKYVILKYKCYMKAFTLNIGTPIEIRVSNIPTTTNYDQLLTDLKYNCMIINNEVFQFDSYKDDYIKLTNFQNEVKYCLLKYFEDEQFIMIIAFSDENRMSSEMNKINDFWHQYEIVEHIQQYYQQMIKSIQITFNQSSLVVNHQKLNYLQKISDESDYKDYVLYVVLDTVAPDFEFTVQELYAIQKRFPQVFVVVELIFSSKQQPTHMSQAQVYSQSQVTQSQTNTFQQQQLQQVKAFYINKLNIAENVIQLQQGQQFLAIICFQNNKFYFQSTDEINYYLHSGNTKNIQYVDEDYHFSITDTYIVLFGHQINKQIKINLTKQFFLFSFLTKEFFQSYKYYLDKLSEFCNLVVFVNYTKVAVEQLEFEQLFQSAKYTIIQDNVFYSNVKKMCGNSRRQFNYLYDQHKNLVDDQGTLEFLYKFIKTQIDDLSERSIDTINNI